MPIHADCLSIRILASLVAVTFAALGAGIAIAAENGDAGTGARDVADKPVTHATESVEACMAKWDPGTHMTKEAWRQSCLRIKQEREPYVRDR